MFYEEMYNEMNNLSEFKFRRNPKAKGLYLEVFCSQILSIGPYQKIPDISIQVSH